MANPYHHACSSAKSWGGPPDDYVAIHDWFEAPKTFMPDFRHRALRHHAQGIFECEPDFGHAIHSSADRMITVQWIGDRPEITQESLSTDKVLRSDPLERMMHEG